MPRKAGRGLAKTNRKSKRAAKSGRGEFQAMAFWSSPCHCAICRGVLWPDNAYVGSGGLAYDCWLELNAPADSLRPARLSTSDSPSAIAIAAARRHQVGLEGEAELPTEDPAALERMVEGFAAIAPALEGMSGEAALDLVEGWEQSHG